MAYASSENNPPQDAFEGKTSIYPTFAEFFRGEEGLCIMGGIEQKNLFAPILWEDALAFQIPWVIAMDKAKKAFSNLNIQPIFLGTEIELNNLALELSQPQNADINWPHLVLRPDHGGQMAIRQMKDLMAANAVGVFPDLNLSGSATKMELSGQTLLFQMLEGLAKLGFTKRGNPKSDEHIYCFYETAYSQVIIDPRNAGAYRPIVNVNESSGPGDVVPDLSTTGKRGPVFRLGLARMLQQAFPSLNVEELRNYVDRKDIEDMIKAQEDTKRAQGAMKGTQY